MGTTEHEEPRFFFILNKGAKSEEIQQQMKELGVEMEIVPLI